LIKKLGKSGVSDFMKNNNSEKKLIEDLQKRNDPEAERLKRFLAMPDLTRTADSPLSDLAKRIADLPRFSEFKNLTVPEIVEYDISFDLFNFPPEHPARKPSDTYFVDESHVLRTHTTVMWYYHMNLPDVRKKIENGEAVGALSHGKVYRKDEIDRQHMNVFHQMDGWYLCRRKEHVITIDDLKEVLVEIARAIFGKDIKYRFNVDEFPYTDPSIEMEVEISKRWIEVLGAGVVRKNVLKNLGVDPEEYNAWAFGFGLERLAIISMDLPDIRLLWSQDARVKKQLKLGNKYREVSKFPPISRDISFVVDAEFIPNDYFDLIRDLGGDLVEEVQLLDKYSNPEKFGSDKLSYTYRIIYRSSDRTLLSDEVDKIQKKIYDETAKKFNAEIR
jgi:phenylalanyl-tRNA synthetase alpha chain